MTQHSRRTVLLSLSQRESLPADAVGLLIPEPGVCCRCRGAGDARARREKKSHAHGRALPPGGCRRQKK